MGQNDQAESKSKKTGIKKPKQISKRTANRQAKAADVAAKTTALVANPKAALIPGADVSAELTAMLPAPYEQPNWPFGLERGPIEGFLRTLIPGRNELIKNEGTGRLYPPYLDGGAERHVRHNWKNELICDGEHCKKTMYGCVHIWEDRFRYGDLKDGAWIPPIAALRIKNTGAAPYSGVERNLPRPNPVVDGLKAATITKHARLKMAGEIPVLVAQLARQLRKENEHELWVNGNRPQRGRRRVDIWEIAVAAVVRAFEHLSYEELDERVLKLHELEDEQGLLLRSTFENTRVIEAMTGWAPRDTDPVERAVYDLRLTHVLNKLRDRLIQYFPKISTVTSVDGMVLSTAATDSSRRGSMTNTKAMHVELHVMYEHRWGFVTAWRLTWNHRGLGSGESPQLPYLVRRTKESLSGVKLISGDMAYGSARNRALMLALGIHFFCPLKAKEFDGETALTYLTPEQIEAEKAKNNLDNPLFRQLYPFRNRVEGWHEVMRSSCGRNLISRPQSPYPQTLTQQAKERLTKAEEAKALNKEIESFKKDPDKAELTLPEDEAGREAIIAKNQFVGRACHNEMLCREIVSLLRAFVKAREWYKVETDFAFVTPFEPRPEDDEFSVFRPRIDPRFTP